MSYLRYPVYIWNDHRLHIWSPEGYDGWRDTVWYQDAAPGEESYAERDARQGEEGPKASGVGVEFEHIDRFVVMRMAELLEEGRIVALIEETVDRFGGDSGNGGCQALTRQRERLVEALRDLDGQTGAGGSGTSTDTEA